MIVPSSVQTRPRRRWASHSIPCGSDADIHDCGRPTLGPSASLSGPMQLYTTDLSGKQSQCVLKPTVRKFKRKLEANPHRQWDDSRLYFKTGDGQVR
ncbi:hypothetical protein BaRGS_00013892 [Batillaria attramentaria]|uniref:Uncharacterized protein n=1 Tax=Batillaria attramentaria TaxID=370345 RepID=A0ABD0L630_9CAEN